MPGRKRCSANVAALLSILITGTSTDLPAPHAKRRKYWTRGYPPKRHIWVSAANDWPWRTHGEGVRGPPAWGHGVGAVFPPPPPPARRPSAFATQVLRYRKEQQHTHRPPNSIIPPPPTQVLRYRKDQRYDSHYDVSLNLEVEESRSLRIASHRFAFAVERKRMAVCIVWLLSWLYVLYGCRCCWAAPAAAAAAAAAAATGIPAPRSQGLSSNAAHYDVRAAARRPGSWGTGVAVAAVGWGAGGPRAVDGPLPPSQPPHAPPPRPPSSSSTPPTSRTAATAGPLCSCTSRERRKAGRR